MHTVATGQKAEAAAAQYLSTHGFYIYDRNWKIPNLCEIDVVATRSDAVYFIEVKYRLTSQLGGGLDYISTSKLRHMQRAAAIWVRTYDFKGVWHLSAIEVGGPLYTVGTFIESIV